jgi:hypothetical protein
MTLLVWPTIPGPAVSHSRRVSSSSSGRIWCGPSALASRSHSSAMVGRPQTCSDFKTVIRERVRTEMIPLDENPRPTRTGAVPEGLASAGYYP